MRLEEERDCGVMLGIGFVACGVDDDLDFRMLSRVVRSGLESELAGWM